MTGRRGGCWGIVTTANAVHCRIFCSAYYRMISGSNSGKDRRDILFDKCQLLHNRQPPLHSTKQRLKNPSSTTKSEIPAPWDVASRSWISLTAPPGATGKVVRLAAEPGEFFSRLMDPHASQTSIFSEGRLGAGCIETSHAAAGALDLQAAKLKNLLGRGP